jgi:hypothetical protein
MGQRKTVTTQEEFTELVRLGKNIVNTDFTFNMGIGDTYGFPTNQTIRFVDCTFQDVSIQFSIQNEVSFTKATIQRLIVCDSGRAMLLKLIDSTVESVKFRDGGSADDFRISNSTTPILSFSSFASRILAIAKSSKIGRLSMEACQNGVEVISIIDSEVTDLAFEANTISKRMQIKNSQITNSAQIFDTAFYDFVIESSICQQLEMRGITVSNIMMINTAQLANLLINSISPIQP